MADDQTTIYFNPKCTKCNLTLGLLKEKGKDPEVVKYLESVPSKEELKKILGLLGISAKQLIRPTETEAYAQAGLSDASSEEEILDAMMEYPILIQRPIVVHNGKAAIGRPPENILDIL